MKEDEIRGSHTFNVDNRVFNITKTKQNEKFKTRTASEASESSNKSIFISANVNHKKGRLKPTIKLFDGEWNYIQHAFINHILFLVIWSWKCDTMLKHNITILQTSVN